MYVFQNNFWPGFDSNNEKDDNCFQILIDILTQVFEKPVKKTNNPYEADILLESIGFGNGSSKLNLKQWNYTILFSGEPRLCPQYAQYDCILWGRESQGKIVCFPLFILDTLASKSIEKLKIKPTPKPNEKLPPPPSNKKLLAIISNGSSTERNRILDKLEKYFKIDYGGEFRNNREKIGGGFHGDEFWKEIAKYRGILCLENTKDTDYVTEKIIHGFAANNVPIYWGATNVENYFNPERYILIESENNMDSAINEIKNILENDEYYYKKVNAPIFPKGMTGEQMLETQLDRIINEMRVCLTMKSTYTPTAPSGLF